MNNSKRLLAGPYLLWMTGFIIIPLILILYYGLTDRNGAFTLANITAISTPEHMKALWLSLVLSFVSTVICLVLAYPLAMILRHRGVGQKSFIVFIFILPMWMNFLLRTYAWMTLLEDNGLINSTLAAIGLPRVHMINTAGAVVLGMVYNYIPYMILPLYSVLTKIDRSVIEAAQDLGASRRKVFLKVVVPLSMPGIISGVTMVFVPAVSTFIISKMLGGGGNLLIGDLIDMQFLGSAYNPNLGSAVSLVLMVIILICMGIMNQFDDGEEAGGGMLL